MPMKWKIATVALVALVVRDEVTLLKNSKLDQAKTETIHNLVEALEHQDTKINYLVDKLNEANVPATEFDLIVLNSNL